MVNQSDLAQQFATNFGDQTIYFPNNGSSGGRCDSIGKVRETFEKQRIDQYRIQDKFTSVKSLRRTLRLMQNSQVTQGEMFAAWRNWSHKEKSDRMLRAHHRSTH